MLRYTKITKSWWLLAISIVGCITSLVIFSFFLISSSDTQHQALAGSYTTDQIIIAVNQERLKKSLPALVIDTKLSQSATNKANDMSNKSYFSHISPVDGKKWSDFIKESGYDYVIAGENLANGFNTVEEMVQAWMNSPSHRENILNKDVTQTGVGISIGKLQNTPTVFVVQVFGKPNSQPQEQAKQPAKAKTTSQSQSSSSSKTEQPIKAENKDKNTTTTRQLGSDWDLPKIPQK